MTKIINTAIFPGTFDPITNGHLAILENAQSLFDKIIVAVAKGHHKNPLFNHDKRIELTRAAAENFINVEVIGFSGLLVDFAKTHQAKWILRGLRNGTDFAHESQLAGMNRLLNNDLETVFILAKDNFQHLSSSMIREIISLNGDVSQFLPQKILELLQKS